MDKVLLLKPIIKKLSDSEFFKKCFFWFIRVLAALTLIGFIYASVKVLENFSTDLPAELIIAMILAELILLILTFVIINIFLIRADDVAALPQSNGYFVTPIFVIFFKMTGEILCSLLALFGIIIGISMLVLENQAGFLGDLLGGFLLNSGVASIVIGPLHGFFTLAVFYGLAELLTIFTDIAKNTKR